MSLYCQNCGAYHGGDKKAVLKHKCDFNYRKQQALPDVIYAVPTVFKAVGGGLETRVALYTEKPAEGDYFEYTFKRKGKHDT